MKAHRYRDVTSPKVREPIEQGQVCCPFSAWFWSEIPLIWDLNIFLGLFLPTPISWVGTRDLTHTFRWWRNGSLPWRAIAKTHCPSLHRPVVQSKVKGLPLLNIQSEHMSLFSLEPRVSQGGKPQVHSLAGRCLWGSWVGAGLHPLLYMQPAAVTRVLDTSHVSLLTEAINLEKFKVGKVWACLLPKMELTLPCWQVRSRPTLSSRNKWDVFQPKQLHPKPAIRWLASHSLSACLAFFRYSTSFKFRNNLILLWVGLDSEKLSFTVGRGKGLA